MEAINHDKFCSDFKVVSFPKNYFVSIGAVAQSMVIWPAVVVLTALCALIPNYVVTTYIIS